MGVAAAVRARGGGCTRSTAGPPRSRKASPGARVRPARWIRCARTWSATCSSTAPLRRCPTGPAGSAPSVVVTVPVLVPSRRRRPQRPRTRRWWKGSGRSRCRGRGSCAGARVRGCGCSPIPRPGWCSPSDATPTGPPPRCSRLVKWRADRCMGPGCGMPASRCDIDHNVAWEDGGETSLTNHAPLCEGHHTVRHHGGWDIDSSTAAPSNGPHPPDASTSSTPNDASPSSAPTPPPAPSPPRPSDTPGGGVVFESRCPSRRPHGAMCTGR